MATGQEHYTEAEDLLARVTLDGNSTPHRDQGVIAMAQVHATLALAAATACAAEGTGVDLHGYGKRD